MSKNDTFKNKKKIYFLEIFLKPVRFFFIFLLPLLVGLFIKVAPHCHFQKSSKKFHKKKYSSEAFFLINFFFFKVQKKNSSKLKVSIEIF